MYLVQSKFIFCFLLLSLLVPDLKAQLLVDVKATKETVNLFKNLQHLAKTNILFGHQHATEYGRGWSGDEDRSDVKSVTGSHPAVIGFDLQHLTSSEGLQYEREKKHLAKQFADTYNRGGVITLSWHFDNPASNTSFYWRDTAIAAVPLLLKGKSHHDVYKQKLRKIADLLGTTRGNDGTLVPVIFRPFHEFDGDWFWWGRSHCTVSEFKALWQFTVSYLRDSLKVHNVLYAFSPDNNFITEAEYLERYPGNAWVDLVGMDNYGDFGRYGKYDLDAAFIKLKIVSDFALKNEKLAALTETGLEGIPDSTWWTERLLKTINREQLNLCYVLVWRNDITNPVHYYAPFPEQVSEKDFLRFFHNKYVMFENDLHAIYKTKEGVQPPVVKRFGQLSVKGNLLVNKAGEPIALKGVSFGWHNWWPRFYNKDAVNELTSKWGVTVLRAAMGVDPKGAYLDDPKKAITAVENVVKACIDKGIYVIIDWHCHTIKESEAIVFFERMATRYHKYPNIIYEIFNEPEKQSWANVKAYSEKVIAAIRKIDKKNIILVGSPHWDQDLHLVSKDPIKGFKNIMYSLHFYAASHTDWLRKRAAEAINLGLPVFVSECGGMEPTGDGPVNDYQWNQWMQFIKTKNLSWVAWSVADKEESCSMLQKTASSNGGWSEADIKNWGKMVRKYLNKK